MPSDLTWHSRWISMAFEVASWSKDPSSHHGCVLVMNNRQISFGYNGMPERVDDSVLHTPDKYNSVIHSEHNAVIGAARCGHTTDGATAYVTGQPCPHCLGNLINAGIKRVIYHPLWSTILAEDDRWLERSQLFHKFVEESKISVYTHNGLSSAKVAFFKGKEYQLEADFNGM